MGTSPQLLVEQVAGIVRRNQLGSLVPVVRYEKRTGRSRMFYFFMAIESESENIIPDPVHSTLLQLSYFRSPLPGGFKLDQIRSMVSAELDVQDYARRITYRVTAAIDEFDPFASQDGTAEAEEAQLDGVLDRTQRYDRLLLWLTSAGAGSKSLFQRACSMLGLDADGKQSGRILRRLRLLGHVELSSDGRRWSAAPSVLVRVPDPKAAYDATDTYSEGPVVYTLCGRRSTYLVGQLRQIATVAEVPQEQGDGPSTLRITVDEPGVFWERVSQLGFGHGLHDGGRVAVRLAQILPPVDGWLQMLEPIPGVVSSMYNTRRYRDGDFVHCHFTGQNGFYQLWPLEPARGESTPKLELFYNAPTDQWLRGDWYGLRFAAQQTSEEACPAKYYPEHARLAVAFDSRWPELYERALTLASGKLPVRNGPWLVYEGITTDLLSELEKKISMDRLD